MDPALLYDVSGADEGVGQLSFRELLIDAEPATDPHAGDHDHAHAASVTATSDGCIDPGVLFDLLEEPPTGVYRLKGTVAVRTGARERTYVVNVVGTSVHVAAAPPTARANCLVAIGTRFDVDAVRDRVTAALHPHHGSAPSVGVRRLAAASTAQHLNGQPRDST